MVALLVVMVPPAVLGTYIMTVGVKIYYLSFLSAYS
jgi:hypothetical protein